MLTILTAFLVTVTGTSRGGLRRRGICCLIEGFHDPRSFRSRGGSHGLKPLPPTKDTGADGRLSTDFAGFARITPTCATDRWAIRYHRLHVARHPVRLQRRPGRTTNRSSPRALPESAGRRGGGAHFAERLLRSTTWASTTVAASRPCSQAAQRAGEPTIRLTAADRSQGGGLPGPAFSQQSLSDLPRRRGADHGSGGRRRTDARTGLAARSAARWKAPSSSSEC